MAKEINLNLDDYHCIQPISIKEIKGERKMYDIILEGDNHKFFIKHGNNDLLMHNCDGSHIRALLLNFFYKFFPHIIDQKRLFLLKTPIISVKSGGEIKYFYSYDEWNNFLNSGEAYYDHRYLKGLGSLNVDDWEIVMNNKYLEEIWIDRSSNRMMEIAFGDNSNLRKKWLQE